LHETDHGGAPARGAQDLASTAVPGRLRTLAYIGAER